MEIKWHTPSSYLHLLSVHQVIWQQHHFLGIHNLLRRFMPEWNFSLEIHVQAYDMLCQISFLAPDIHMTEYRHMKCGMQTHKSTCSNLLSSLCRLIARQQHKLITAEREPIVLTKPTFIKVQQPHSQQTEMSSLSWIMPWQTHTLLIQCSKSAGTD